MQLDILYKKYQSTIYISYIVFSIKLQEFRFSFTRRINSTKLPYVNLDML